MFLSRTWSCSKEQGNPGVEHATMCSTNLKELSLLDPKLIVAVGKLPAASFGLRGKNWRNDIGSIMINEKAVPVVAVAHPASRARACFME